MPKEPLETKEFTCPKCGARQKPQFEPDRQVPDAVFWDNKCFYCGHIFDPEILPRLLGIA